MAMQRRAAKKTPSKAVRTPDESSTEASERAAAVLALQRNAGNRAVSAALTSPASLVPSAAPAPLAVQRAPATYEPGESATATARGIISPDVRLLGGTGSGYNASPDSVLVADFRPNSAVVRTSASSELHGSWIKILEGSTTRKYALLGFSDATGDEGPNQKLRADRAHAIAALLPGTASRGVVGAAPATDFVIPGNATKDDRALNRAVLIRLPPDELRQEAQVEAYSGAAVEFWRANPDKSLTDLVHFVGERAVARLSGNGVPEPDVVPGTVPKGSTTLAYFDAQAWTITIDTNALAAASPQTGVTPATKLATLNAASIAELAQACYHEARHAEQTFLAARTSAEEAKGSTDPATLSRAIGIPPAIADAAIAASLTVLPDVLKAKANAWRTFMHGGRYLPYKVWNEGLKDQLDILHLIMGPKMDEWTKLGPGGIQTLWEKFFHPQIDKSLRRDFSLRADALLREMNRDPHHEQVDADVKSALTKTAGKLFIALVKEREAARLPDSAAIAGMSSDDRDMATINAQVWLLELHMALLEAGDAADEAYRHYANEADAYEVGDAVRASVVRQGGTGP